MGCRTSPCICPPGPQGDPGPIGPDGPQGIQGVQGPAGTGPSNLTASTLTLLNGLSAVTVSTISAGAFMTAKHDGNGIDYVTDVASSFVLSDNVQAAIGTRLRVAPFNSAQIITNSNINGLDMYGDKSGIRFNINNTSVPLSFNAGECGIYVQNGALYYRGLNGTVTMLAAS